MLKKYKKKIWVRSLTQELKWYDVVFLHTQMHIKEFAKRPFEKVWHWVLALVAVALSYQAFILICKLMLQLKQ